METYNNYDRLARNYTLLADEYEFTMSDVYLDTKYGDNEVVFDVFFRRIPNDGGYAIMAGLDQIIPYIQNLRFGEQQLSYFRKWKYPKEFINYLENFKFTGDIYAIPDGTPVFPNEPLITVKAPLIQAQIVETAILAIINGAMSHATGARRIIEATPRNTDVVVDPIADDKYGNQKIPTMEFGARRADGLEAAIDSSIYGIMAGCSGTSNIMAAHMLNIKALGTMAHSYIQTFDSELEAFKQYARKHPENCILLVDTIDTLRSGVPNAIKTFKYMEENNIDISHIGIRIDSGDLAYLSKETRKMLDEAGFPQAKICLSNGLTDKAIASLVMQGANFNSIGVGDNISKPEGNMGCVYKEVSLNKNGIWEPKIKLSNDEVKIINPDYKNLYRAYDRETGYALADIMTRRTEKVSEDDLLIVSPRNKLKRKMINNFELVKLQKPIFVKGELVYDDPNIFAKQSYCNSQMNTLYPEVKRIMEPHEYYVDGTLEYVEFKNDMIEKYKRLVRKI